MQGTYKTGIIYDEFLTKHKSRRKHPQKPQRVQAIIKSFKQAHYLTHPKVEYIDKITRKAQKQDLLLAHTQKYIKGIQNLWPKTSHRTDITVLDTYFNQFTDEVSRLAIGSLLDSVDKLQNATWKNAFAVIRPPGHHSGGRNTVNGFCVYNNVAIAAKYAVSKYNYKKVMILDWDVHHGDGTQHILRNDPNILFSSIHRYDRATFYPTSQQGHYSNNGQGQKLNINIPINFVDEKFTQYKFQAPGDNQYIYIINRIIIPIMEQYQPDFVMISAGFDAARYDPLGGFSITPNGYYYMTRRLQEFCQQLQMTLKLYKKIPFLVVLEGGYNIASTSQCATAVMRALLQQQQLPIKCDYQYKDLKTLCQIPSVIFQQFQQMVQFHSKKWKRLMNQQYTIYEKMIKQNTKKVFGIVEEEQSSSSSQQIDPLQNEDSQRRMTRSVAQEKRRQIQEKKIKQLKKKKSEKKQIELLKKESENKIYEGIDQMLKQSEVTQSSMGDQAKQFHFAAGHLQRFKNFSINNPKVLKWCYESEIKFYERNDIPQKIFAPKYYGQEGSYVILENLLHEQKQPVVMDIKLSKQSKNPLISQETRQKEKKKQMKSTTEKYGFRISGYTTPNFKEGGILNNDQQFLMNVLRKVVTEDNVVSFLSFLEQMTKTIKLSTRKYFGTSIVLIRGLQKSMIKWVDFHYWIQTDTYDSDLQQGLQNLIKFLQDLNTSFTTKVQS